MEGVLVVKKTFIKPNMANLKGKSGRHILETIKTTKPSSHEKLKHEVNAAIDEILELKKNGE